MVKDIGHSEGQQEEVRIMSSKIDLTLSDDHKSVQMTLSGEGTEPKVEVPLSLEQVTHLISVLGRVRETMLADQDVQPIEGARFTPVTRTRWALQPEARTEGSVLAFQHPAFGPIGLVLTPEDSDRLMRGLHLHQQLRQEQKANRGKLN
ncbi:hypothetical protein [Acetobacter senegalensis]|uniref:hypothetical protein n=1 Tax=Acetobacter senegalensis TaxID=446692 RepID=UPI0009EE9C9A|nr:hypothetical protein [Acetobacter senegalensis]